MPLTMAEKQAISRRLCERYRRASKKQKGEILETLCDLTGYTRDHAARLMRTGPPPRGGPKKQRRSRARVYDAEVLFALRRVWATISTAFLMSQRITC